MNIYFISGLGADERVFKRLRLPETYHIIHIKWPNLSEKETLCSYTAKISNEIDTSQEFALIGLSFGGIIATELAKTIKPRITIIISSISSYGEMPLLYKTIGIFKLNRLVPETLMNKIYPFTNWYFGIKQREDKTLLRNVILDTSPRFLKWAINEVLQWKSTEKPGNLFHIHGTEDRIFPYRLTKADAIVHKGGHLMVYVNAGVVSKIILEKLQQK